MVLRKNELREIFHSRTYGEKKILTWKGIRRIKLLDKGAALHDIWDAFCREFDEQRRFLKEEVAQMRQQIESEKEKSGVDLMNSAPGYVFEELRILFQELDKELRASQLQFKNGHANLLERIRSVLAGNYEEQFRIVNQTEKDSEEQMHKLRRRLERMAKDLQLSEDEVTRLRSELAQAYDGGGVASIYKTVQGLSQNESNIDTKKDLLSKLFESNLEIRKNLH